MAKTISFVKGKGSLRHNNRDFIASNIDEKRIPWNVTYIQQSLSEAYEQLFGEAVAEYNSKQRRSDRKIDDYLSKIKHSGNNEKIFYENVVQIGKMSDTGVVADDGPVSADASKAQTVLDKYARTFQERNPNLYLFNAVLHMDEATPHLHLDYIPIAHGYKTGMKVRNSLTKAFQEQGISPAVSKTDTETMHWQERERAYLMELCHEHEIAIEVLGEDRDSYSISEYKQAMREKEAAEAEVEILLAEKVEIESTLASIDEQLEAGRDEIEDHKATLEEINAQLAEAEKKVQSKTADMDKIIAAGKPVEKEIKEIRNQASKAPQIFGGEPMIKIPEKVFEKMIARYRVAGTFENLSKEYNRNLSEKQNFLDKALKQIKSLKDKLKKYDSFLGEKGLVEVFAEFIRPKSVHENMAEMQKIVDASKEKPKNIEVIPKKKHDIAI